MVPLYETQFTHLVENRTRQQVEEAIRDGATKAGWVIDGQNEYTFLASYRIRIHTVKVGIHYSGGTYRVNYVSSDAMKMYCTQQDRQTGRYIVTGRDSCVGNMAPQYINANYKLWIDQLTAAIDDALDKMQ